jgi:hypothetical protein
MADILISIFITSVVKCSGIAFHSYWMSSTRNWMRKGMPSNDDVRKCQMIFWRLLRYTVVDEKGGLISKQTSVVRTNCMDCLDRTNVVQSEVAKHFLTLQMREAGILSSQQSLQESEFLTQFKNGKSVFCALLLLHCLCWRVSNLVWADHADAISMVYSGTGALKTDFTR